MDPTKTMTLGEHLDELRIRIILSFIFLFLTTCVCFYYADSLLKFVVDPFLLVMKEQGYNPRIVQNNIAGAFLAHLKVAILAGFFLSSPLIFQQMWVFIGAGLYPEERKYIYLFAPLSVGCFILGVLFFYFIVLPFGLRFLIAYGNTADNQFIEPLITINDYFSFFVVLSLVLGFTFEVPIIMGFLNRTGIVQSETFEKQRKIFLLGAFFFAAVLTPPDVATQVLVAIPMISLYQVGILLTRYLEGKGKSKKEILLMTLIPFFLVGVVYYASQNVIEESKFRTTPIEETFTEYIFEGKAFQNSQEKLLPFFMEATQDPKPLTRFKALNRLRPFTFKTKVSLYKEALSDPDFGVSALACTILKEDFNDSAGLVRVVKELSSPAKKNRLLAFLLLYEWSKDDFGYQPDKNPKEQKIAIKKWKEWVEKERASKK